MPKLPLVSGRTLVRALEKLGFQQVSQRGSHVKMRSGTATCIVPLQAEIKRGTLSGILRQAKLMPDDLLKVLLH